MKSLLAFMIALGFVFCVPANAEPMTVKVNKGTIDPVPIAISPFHAQSPAEAAFAKWRGQAWKLGVVAAFLLMINLLTSPGHLWFYWPALGFCFLLLMRWPSGVDPRRLWQSRRQP